MSKILYDLFQTYKSEFSYNPSYISDFWRILMIYVDQDIVPSIVNECMRLSFKFTKESIEWSNKQLAKLGALLLLKEDLRNPYSNRDRLEMKEIKQFETCVFNMLQEINLNLQTEAILKMLNYESRNSVVLEHQQEASKFLDDRQQLFLYNNTLIILFTRIQDMILKQKDNLDVIEKFRIIKYIWNIFRKNIGTVRHITMMIKEHSNVSIADLITFYEKLLWSNLISPAKISEQRFEMYKNIAFPATATSTAYQDLLKRVTQSADLATSNAQTLMKELATSEIRSNRLDYFQPPTAASTAAASDSQSTSLFPYTKRPRSLMIYNPFVLPWSVAETENHIFLPVIRYENLYYSSVTNYKEQVKIAEKEKVLTSNNEFCGKFYYFEPSSEIILDLGTKNQVVIAATKVHAFEIMLLNFITLSKLDMSKMYKNIQDSKLEQKKKVNLLDLLIPIMYFKYPSWFYFKNFNEQKFSNLFLLRLIEMYILTGNNRFYTTIDGKAFTMDREKVFFNIKFKQGHNDRGFFEFNDPKTNQNIIHFCKSTTDVNAPIRFLMKWVSAKGLEHNFLFTIQFTKQQILKPFIMCLLWYAVHMFTDKKDFDMFDYIKIYYPFWTTMVTERNISQIIQAPEMTTVKIPMGFPCGIISDSKEKVDIDSIAPLFSKAYLDEFDQILCRLGIGFGFTCIILQKERGEYRATTEVIDLRLDQNYLKTYEIKKDQRIIKVQHPNYNLYRRPLPPNQQSWFTDQTFVYKNVCPTIWLQTMGFVQ